MFQIVIHESTSRACTGSGVSLLSTTTTPATWSTSERISCRTRSCRFFVGTTAHVATSVDEVIERFTSGSRADGALPPRAAHGDRPLGGNVLDPDTLDVAPARHEQQPPDAPLVAVPVVHVAGPPVGAEAQLDERH